MEYVLAAIGVVVVSVGVVMVTILWDLRKILRRRR